MGTINANQLANVQPSVLNAGGEAVAIVGVALTTNTRVPIGQVLGFPTGPAVSSYFGPASAESLFANGGVNGAGVSIGSGYFGGFENSDQIPGQLYFAQYPITAVSAYLRGGNVSSLTTAQLQAISGSLDVVIDGYARNAASVNLSAATSFSSAAGIIQTALNAADPSEATFTASMGASFTGTASGTNLTVTSVTGFISIGDVLTGTGIPAGTTIKSQTSGTTGGAGVYVTSVSTTASAASITSASTVMDVTAVASGSLSVGQTVNTGPTGLPVITSQISGTAGGIGLYQLSGTAQSVVSGSFASEGTPVAVTFDSVSGGFVITSGITGTPSTAAFATGTISTVLGLTAAAGAVLSQGAAAAAPATFMNQLVTTQSNWATFTTLFNPDGNTGLNTVKQAFAAWKNSQNNRFAYICWDTDIAPTQSVPATESLGYVLANNNDSGTCLIYEPGDYNLAAFIMGAAASIDFEEAGGRISFAYKMQPGLTASVTDPTVALNLGGNPQDSSATDRGNGYNFYGAYGTATSAYTWFQRGFVTGPYLWLDSYINQIWLNSLFQSDLLNLQQNSKSIPYSTSGAALLETALADSIAQGLSFGAFGPDTLSASQIQQVNTQAQANVANTLQSQGYYLQIGTASPTVRAARSSPPAIFWYIDQGSVQAINLQSVALL